MCFSEEVSFVASGTLALASAVCFYLARHKKQFYALAVIPLFFALQQAAEGIQWLVFKNIWGSLQDAHTARDLFLIIAYAVWPFWIPFSLWVVEPQASRRRWLQLLLIIGLIISLYEAWKIFFFPVDSYIENKSIQYHVEVYRNWLWPYLIATIVPWFVSSLRYTTLMGCLLIIGVFLAAYLYYITFISVWCFLAAVMSICILFTIASETH